MHFWSKFGNNDFNQSWLIARTNSQAQNGVNFDFEVKFDLEGQGLNHTPPPPKKQKNKKKQTNKQKKKKKRKNKKNKKKNNSDLN